MVTPVQIRVDAVQLRQLFNQAQFYQRLRSGEFQAITKRDDHPSAPLGGEPVCTRSQIVVYLDAAGEKIAHVHQYLRSDDSLGLSGLPDPKRILLDGVVYWTP